MRPTASTRKWERIGLSLKDLDLPGLMFSTAHSRSRKIRKVRLKVRDASYMQLMRQNGPPCPVFSGVGSGARPKSDL